MALTKDDAVVTPYVRGTPPTDKKAINQFLIAELRRVELTLSHLTLLAPQVAISEPPVKLKGMYRYNKAPWNPLATGDGWVHYDGTNWTAV